MRFALVISTLVATALLGTTVTASPIPPAKAYYTETDPAPEGSERADSYHTQKMERRATHQQSVHVGMDHSPVESAHEKQEEGLSKVAREFKFSTIHPSVVNTQNTACVKGDCSLTEVEETCLFNKNTHTGLPCTPKGATDTGKDRSDSPAVVNIDTDTKIITPASSANKVVQVPHRRRRAHHP